jgi:predicted amidohydrolase YtcJ
VGGSEPRGAIEAAVAPSVASHAIDRRAAFACATIGAAALGREERIKGRIAAGFLADFVVWDRDPHKAGASVAVTVRGGRVVHGAL